MSPSLRFSFSAPGRSRRAAALRVALLPAALAAFFLAGCAATPKTPAELKAEVEAGPLAFLQDGQTTREQVLLRLGIPSADFENHRILTYRLAYGPGTSLIVYPRDRQIGAEEAAWNQATYSLVLVFAPNNALQKHALVPMKTPLP
jgi:hypothetical protein